MNLSYHQEEDRTLIDYFKQMLDENEPLNEGEIELPRFADETAAEPQAASGGQGRNPEDGAAAGSPGSGEQEASAAPGGPLPESAAPVTGEREASAAPGGPLPEPAAPVTGEQEASAAPAGHSPVPADGGPAAEDAQGPETLSGSPANAADDSAVTPSGAGGAAEQADPRSYGLSAHSLNEFVARPELAHMPEQSRREPVPLLEGPSLETLLRNVTEIEVAPETAVEQQTETAEQTETVGQTVTAAEEQTAAAAEVKQAAETRTAPAGAAAYADLNWRNIEMPDEFQALFFLVHGIRFAVPLVELGAIFNLEKLTPLFGKPHWYIGLADIRGKKINVVDTLKWVKPEDQGESNAYEYGIILGNSSWAVGCNVLEGNRVLNRDKVKWRQQAGNRPWLAGIVKEEMCALLHVQTLIRMFEHGFDLHDLQNKD